MSNEYIETKYTREDIFNNLKYGTDIRRAICETLRQIYDYVYEMPESELKQQLTDKLVDTMWIAKLMGERLSYLFWKYHDTTGHLRYRVTQKYDKHIQHEVRKMRLKRT